MEISLSQSIEIDTNVVGQDGKCFQIAFPVEHTVQVLW